MKYWGLSAILFAKATWGLADEGNVVAAYYENWSQYRPPSGGRAVFFPKNIDPTIITDIHFAFAIFGFVDASLDPNNPHLTGDFSIQPVEWNDQSVLYQQIQGLKQINPKLRSILTIGGWGFNDPNDPNGIGKTTYKLFSQMVSTEASRTQFIQSAIAYVKQYGFDGIEIDWEYPGDLTRGGSNADFGNFLTLLSEMQTACKAQSPPLVLCYASPALIPSGVPAQYRDNPQTYYQWLKECSDYVDRMHVMTYDYHGAFDNPKVTGVNAPLMADTDPSSTNFIKATMENYINNGVDPQKIVLGLAGYGHSYSGVENLTETSNGPGHVFSAAGDAGPSTKSPGFLAYYEIADATATNQLTFGTDSTTQTAYGYNTSTQQWVSFDTPDTIALKAQYAKSLGLKGVMFWAIDDDEYAWGNRFPNLRSAYQVMAPQTADFVKFVKIPM
jgi:chitinase